jgi:hypothetical protein
LARNPIGHNNEDEPGITITAEERDETVRRRVANKESDVPDDQQSTGFGWSEKGLESPGTELGLYLVDTLVDSDGGDV